MTTRKKVAIGAAVAVAAACAFLMTGGGKDKASEGELYAEVQEGPLVISVEEYGEIVPSQQIVLKNEVQGRCSIISLIPEGSIVNEGDVLVQLDVSAKIDEKDSQEIILQNAESSLEVAREALEIQKNQSASDVELAEEAFVFAKEDLEKYEKGEYPAKLINQKGQLALKEQQVKQAKDKYDWSKKLFAENFISETELESDELSWKSSQLTLETAKRELEVLETYTHRRDLAKFKSDMKQKEMALERTKKKAASAIAQAESTLRAKESEFRKQYQRLEKLTNEIAKCTPTKDSATASRCRRARRCGSARRSYAFPRPTPSPPRSTCTRRTSRASPRECLCASGATRFPGACSPASSQRSHRCPTMSAAG